MKSKRIGQPHAKTPHELDSYKKAICSPDAVPTQHTNDFFDDSGGTLCMLQDVAKSSTTNTVASDKQESWWEIFLKWWKPASIILGGIGVVFPGVLWLSALHYDVTYLKQEDGNIRRDLVERISGVDAELKERVEQNGIDIREVQRRLDGFIDRVTERLDRLIESGRASVEDRSGNNTVPGNPEVSKAHGG